MRAVRVIGPGRAGRSLAAALAGLGWEVAPLLGRGDDPTGAASDVDLLVIATPDASIPEVARSVAPTSGAVVAHMSGAMGLDALEPHPRRAGLHPLVSMPDPEVGARRLSSGAWFAVAGDPLAREVVEALGGRWFEVSDEDRAAYHAAAAVASNHLVVLLAQVEELAAGTGAPFEAYLDLARATIENVAELGAAGALTGPAARGDWATLERHLEALPVHQRESYEALARAARALAERRP